MKISIQAVLRPVKLQTLVVSLQFDCISCIPSMDTFTITYGENTVSLTPVLLLRHCLCLYLLLWWGTKDTSLSQKVAEIKYIWISKKKKRSLVEFYIYTLHFCSCQLIVKSLVPFELEMMELFYLLVYNYLCLAPG